MSVYEVNGLKHSHFDPDEHEKYDALAKDAARQFWLSQEGVVSVQDNDRTNNPKFKNPDLLVTKNNGRKLLVEAEIKNGFEYALSGGAHVADRKSGSLKVSTLPMVLCMFNPDCSQMLLIPGRALREAASVKGYAGRFGSQTSHDYSGPGTNGCTRIFKWNSRDREETHFLEVPYKCCGHVKLQGKQYITIKKMEAWL